MNLKNKKGDVTVTILVIGIIAVCFMALISFYLAELNTDKNFEGIGKIAKASSNMENYLYFGKSVINTRTNGDSEHIYEEKIDKGFFSSKKVFEVRYYLP